jgi:transcriptional regulator with XRE-family HTH domain
LPVEQHPAHVTEPSEETVGQRIKRLRLERGLSQRELAEPGISYAYLSRIEAGQRQPSVNALRIVAKKLGVSVEHLETGDPIPALARLELELGDAELALRLGTDLDHADALFGDVLAEADEAEEPALAARAAAGLGLIAAHRSANVEAIRYLEAATSSGYLPPQARPDVYHALGDAYMASDQAMLAVVLWERVLDQLRATQPPDLALLLRFGSYLSWAYSELGRIDRARPVLDEATQIAEDESVLPQVRVGLYWELARHSWMEDADAHTALGHMRHAIGLLEASEDTYQLARAHLLCAQLLNLDGTPKAAARHLARAEPLLVRLGERSEIGVLRAEQSKLAAAREEGKRALELAKEAADLLGDDARHVGLREHALAVAHAANGDLDTATRHFEAAVTELEQRRQWREASAAAREWGTNLNNAGRQAEAFDAIERAISLSDRSSPRVEQRAST